MLKVKVFLVLLPILMGSLDCLTTVIGKITFTGVELNPLLAGVVNTNLVIFVIVKLAASVLVALMLVLAEKVLMKSPNKETLIFRFTGKLIKGSYFGIVGFLAILVVNNMFVLTGIMR